MSLRRFLHRFVSSQQWLSTKFDSILPLKFSRDGNRHFLDAIVPEYITDNLSLYDVGGGKQPYCSVALKNELRLQITGVDISEEELQKAPKGSYDHIIVADILEYEGNGDADLVLCQSLLEHVADVSKALHALSTICKPEGKILIFVPSRHALYARLNVILPETFKRKVLYTVFPHTRAAQGFPAYYDRCSPREFQALAAEQGLRVEKFYPYYKSSYFSFFFPFYILWRIWVLTFYIFRHEQAAETFSLVLSPFPESS